MLNPYPIILDPIPAHITAFAVEDEWVVRGQFRYVKIHVSDDDLHTRGVYWLPLAEQLGRLQEAGRFRWVDGSKNEGFLLLGVVGE